VVLYFIIIIIIIIIINVFFAMWWDTSRHLNIEEKWITKILVINRLAGFQRAVE